MSHSFSTHISWGSKHDPIMFKNICLVLPGSSNILGAQYTWKTNLTLPNRLRASKMVQWGKAYGAKQGKERSATHGTQFWQKKVRQMEAGGRELASPDVSSAGTVTQTHVTLPDWSAPFSAAASDATLPDYSPPSPLFRPSQLCSSQTVSF